MFPELLLDTMVQLWDNMWVWGVQVMEGVALVVAALPPSSKPAALQAVFNPVVAPMHGLLAARPQPHDDVQKQAILTLTDRLGVLFRCHSTSFGPPPPARVCVWMPTHRPTRIHLLDLFGPTRSG